MSKNIKEIMKVKAYCQNCQKIFKRTEGLVIGSFILCSKKCEERLVMRNPEFLYKEWLLKYPEKNTYETLSIRS